MILHLCTLDYHINIHALFMSGKHISCATQPIQHMNIFIIWVRKPKRNCFAHKIPPSSRSYSSGAASPESLAHTSIHSAESERFCS